MSRIFTALSYWGFMAAPLHLVTRNIFRKISELGEWVVEMTARISRTLKISYRNEWVDIRVQLTLAHADEY